MSIQWPEPMPDGGRVRITEREDSFRDGARSMHDETRSCQQTLHVSLFFDGTNNNDANVNRPSDSTGHCHINVAASRQSTLTRNSSCSRTFSSLRSLLLSACVALAACTGVHTDAASTVDVRRHVELLGGGVSALNYTPWYIHSFAITGPKGSGIEGGGPNVWPMENGTSKPSGGGKEVCCMTYPREWQPDLRLTVRWLVDKKSDGKTPGYWYKAENVRIAQYDGSKSGGVWGIFLPGDRVRVMVTDGNHDGGNNANNRPPDDDPYIAQGVLDDEWNRLYRKKGTQ